MVRNPEDYFREIMRPVPRGNSEKFLTDQQSPKAQFHPPKIIAESPDLRYDPKNPQGKILLGALGSQLVGYKDDRHLTSIAGTRGGKSLSLINNLFFYDGSVIVIDPSGGVVEATALAREAMGQKVYLLDPYKQVKGAAAKFRVSFNAINDLTLANPYIIENTDDICESIIVKNPDTKEPHWDEAASDIYQTIILYVAVSPFIKKEDRNLVTTRKIAMKLLKWDEKRETYIFKRLFLLTTKMLRRKGYHHVADTIEEGATSFYDKRGGELSSVTSTLRRHLRLLKSRAICDTIQSHDFDIEDCKRNPAGVTIYVVLPQSRYKNGKGFMRLMINKAIAALEREQMTPRQNVLLAIDELPALGYMETLENAIAMLAKHHVKMWSFIQDVGQMEQVYKKRWTSFVANAGVVQAFATTDYETNKFLSKQLGNTTIAVTTQRETSRKLQHEGLSGEDIRYERFPLMEEHEIARTFARDDPMRRQLNIIAGKHPIILQGIRYWETGNPLENYLQ